MKNSSKIALGIGIAAVTMPVFSSGLKRDLTFAQWIWNHTKWGPLPTYLPRENLQASVDEFGIRHVDGNYYAMKRYGWGEHDLREWITPDDSLVKEYSCALWNEDRDTFILNVWNWVCSEFVYGRELWGDFWRFPVETLTMEENYEKAVALHNEMRLPVLPPRRPITDCEDLSYLATSLLIAGGVDAYANIGHYGNIMHAWVTVDRNGVEHIIEPTLSGRLMAILLQVDPWLTIGRYPEYVARYRFNHLTVHHLTR